MSARHTESPFFNATANRESDCRGSSAGTACGIAFLKRYTDLVSRQSVGGAIVRAGAETSEKRGFHAPDPGKRSGDAAAPDACLKKKRKISRKIYSPCNVPPF